MKKVLLLSVLCLVFSCNNDDDPINRQLNEFERTIIPFNQEESVQFVNELDDTLSVTISAKTLDRIFSQQNIGPVYSLEREFQIYVFDDSRERIGVIVRKDTEDNTEFLIVPFDFLFFGLGDCENDYQDIQPLLTDATIDGNTFSNVFVLEPCNIGLNETDINQIIYSLDRGIEYIEYNDGRFFKQVE